MHYDLFGLLHRSAMKKGHFPYKNDGNCRVHGSETPFGFFIYGNLNRNSVALPHATNANRASSLHVMIAFPRCKEGVMLFREISWRILNWFADPVQALVKSSKMSLDAWVS